MAQRSKIHLTRLRIISAAITIDLYYGFTQTSISKDIQELLISHANAVSGRELNEKKVFHVFSKEYSK